MPRDVNQNLPKIPGLKWGALTNKYPTNARIDELNKILPHDGSIHQVFYGDKFNYIDGVRIAKHKPTRWT